ncbi:NAD(P)-dependent alcohol dehydrogenase [Microbacterium rhizosphaerae]|uniref:NAD(P)-dependent alcohol dehydrogenase n=1 Tax=Microbacterium rhizosphaerae TaxID=1678237 RepID=A0ABZ0SVV6_9MICO|nr:NAD(P)-dependent alcohol dehydrogenase [Microbacterium rhizosphaerae]WPR91387.1 NAD(P)-dependent alcohol dehydrogenase [Microbacterium rhizosphaerae]
MDAWTQTRYGGVDEVRLSRIDVPQPKTGEVLLRIRATGLNAADRHLMTGEPLLLRAAFGWRRPRQPVRGIDVAGSVLALGPDVPDVSVGDEVVGELAFGGGLAEYAVIAAERLVPRPAAVGPALAAALPIAGGTAWQALDRARVASGHRVLVVGASGGVGTFAVQLAVLRGAEVHAVCSERNRALVGSIGARTTYDRAATPLDALPAGTFDAVLDLAGDSPLRTLRRLVRDGGSAVLIAGEGGRLVGPIPRIARASLLSVRSRRPLHPLSAKARPDILRELLSLVAGGRLTPVIERTWPLVEAGEALAHLAAGHTVGKVVVTRE